MNRSNKISIFLFFCLLAIFGGLVVYNHKNLVLKRVNKTQKAVKPTEVLEKSTTIQLPAALDDVGVTAVYAHYFFSGIIKSIADQEIILRPETSKISKFPLSPETRLSKISPPYSQKTSSPITKSQLMPNQQVDISAEYDLRTNQWLTRDVFLPTDRN